MRRAVSARSIVFATSWGEIPRRAVSARTSPIAAATWPRPRWSWPERALARLRPDRCPTGARLRIRARSAPPERQNCGAPRAANTPFQTEGRVSVKLIRCPPWDRVGMAALSVQGARMDQPTQELQLDPRRSVETADETRHGYSDNPAAVR